MKLNNFSIRNILVLLAVLAAMFIAASFTNAEEHQGIRGQFQPQQPRQPQPQHIAPAQPARPVQRLPMPAMAQRPAAQVDRFNHGNIRHIDTHVFRPPVVANQAQRPDNRRPDVAWQGQRHNAIVYHDVDVDTHHSQYWHHFVFGQRRRSLRSGYIQIFINATPYYYDDGIYYQLQSADSTYQEVYPPVGAVVQTLPDGAIEVYTTDATYYYAGGAFYAQNENGFEIVPVPLGVIVPELPPGAIQVNINGEVMYQFNGIYYQPIFENGVTQYITTAV